MDTIINTIHGLMGGEPGELVSWYPGEEISKIPLVAASERGAAKSLNQSAVSGERSGKSGGGGDSPYLKMLL